MSRKKNFLGITWTGLFAADLTALVSFYVERVGLPIVENGDGYCMLDVGGGAVFELWADGARSSSEDAGRAVGDHRIRGTFSGVRYGALEQSWAPARLRSGYIRQ